MRHIKIAFAVPFIFFSGIGSHALAHSPYFGERKQMVHPEFGPLEFAVLYGDGIFTADPSRVVVIDREGSLIASTPLSYSYIIRCPKSGSTPACSAYDSMGGVVFEPDDSEWSKGEKIIEDGRPSRDAYPEYMDVEYGFTARPATLLDIFLFEVTGLLDNPTSTLLAILWWTVACLVAARMFWRRKRDRRDIRPVTPRSTLINFAGVSIFCIMFLLAAYGWLVTLYSLYYFMFVLTSGAALALLVTRPRTAGSDS